MAVDKQKAGKLVEQIDELFQAVTAGLPKEVTSFLKNKVMGEALAELEELIGHSRPPVLYIMGRSGHGKSSLINALANKEVASVGDVKPHTPGSECFTIDFPDLYATWDVIDSRGIFETTKVDGAPQDDAIRQVRSDLDEYKPDVIIYAISARETRAMAHDFDTMNCLLEHIGSKNGVVPPVALVLTMSDLVEPVREQWPPNESASERLDRLKRIIEYVGRDRLKASDLRSLHTSTPWAGCICEGSGKYQFIIPTAAPPDEPSWNIETLSLALVDVIPKEARLFFSQAQRRKIVLRRISSSLIKRFSVIAGSVGLSPMPVADLAILVPLQMLMIATIGGLSCREFSKKTAMEFLSASGVNVAIGYGLRRLAQQVVKLVPVAGPFVSGAIAGTGTYSMGKSAEYYFFHGELRRPDEFKDDWNEGCT